MGAAALSIGATVGQFAGMAKVRRSAGLFDGVACDRRHGRYRPIE